MNRKSQSISQPKVAIITVTYNSADFIDEYLSSVAHFLKESEHRLIIVDNRSSDNTCELIREFALNHNLTQQLHIDPLKENSGFGKGCNKGAEIAQRFAPDYYWFLNPDTRLLEDSGSALLALFAQQPETDFAGSVLINEQSMPRPGAFRFPGLLNIILSNLRLGLLDKLFSDYTTAIPLQLTPYDADWLTGASFMVKKSCFEQLKGFDPFYFLYFEEVDLFLRAKKRGHTVKACPNSKIFHISGASTGINTKNTKPKRRPDYWFESRRHFYTKNFGRGYFTLADILFLISHSLWLARCKLQGKDSNTPPYLAKDIIRHSSFTWLAKKK
jgi:GT2 family glycosyltransferase